MKITKMLLFIYLFIYYYIFFKKRYKIMNFIVFISWTIEAPDELS